MNSSQYFIQSVYRSVLVLIGHLGLLQAHKLWVSTSQRLENFQSNIVDVLNVQFYIIDKYDNVSHLYY